MTSQDGAASSLPRVLSWSIRHDSDFAPSWLGNRELVKT